jgi:hypothetical protein
MLDICVSMFHAWIAAKLHIALILTILLPDFMWTLDDTLSSLATSDTIHTGTEHAIWRSLPQHRQSENNLEYTFRHWLPYMIALRSPSEEGYVQRARELIEDEARQPIGINFGIHLPSPTRLTWSAILSYIVYFVNGTPSMYDSAQGWEAI